MKQFRLPSNDLTVADTDDIERMASQGMTALEIVRAFGVDGDFITGKQVREVCSIRRIHLSKAREAS